MWAQDITIEVVAEDEGCTISFSAKSIWLSIFEAGYQDHLVAALAALVTRSLGANGEATERH